MTTTTTMMTTTSLARHAQQRAGYTLIEIVIALAVVGVLAGVLSSQVLGRLSKGEAAALSQNLQSLATGMQSFREDVGRYPDSIQHLASLPGGARDLCGRNIPAGAHAQWSGPYVVRTIPTTGLATGSAMVIRSDIVRSPTSAGTASPVGTSIISVDGVDRPVADQLEAAFDGNADLAGGTIRWTAAAGTDRGTLYFELPVRGC